MEKHFYVLIKDDKIRKKVVSFVEDVAKKLSNSQIECIFIVRKSLKEAQKRLKDDLKISFSMAIIDLAITKADREKFEEIRVAPLPEFSINTFSALFLAVKIQKRQEDCKMIFLLPVVRRVIVAYLLSKEVNGNWAAARNQLTKSLVALWFKFFILPQL